jgi:arginase family enzyme
MPNMMSSTTNTPCSRKPGRKGRPLSTLTALAACVLLCSNLASAAEDWQLPDELGSKLQGLRANERSFVTNGSFLEFMSARQMELELANRDAASVQSLITDLIAVAEEMGYDPSRDMGAMPLNIKATGFNNGILLPPILRDDTRSPGPFSVHGYLFPESGVPTFAGAPVAVWPEDLTAGAVDVAIVGIPSDMSSGRRNAEAGPDVMRSLNTIAELDIQTLVDPMTALSVVDYGDFRVDNMSIERTVDHITQMVAETAATSATPMMVGGDTSILYPAVKGIAQVHGNSSFGLVHFSAHPDARRDAVHTISDDQALFMLINEGLVDGSDLITVGLRGNAATETTLQWLQDNGVRYHTMAEVNRSGYDAVMDRVISELDALPEQLFVSIDVSVVDPGDLIAAGRVSANGLSINDVTSTVRYLCAAREIVGFEITDLAPVLDLSRLSALNSNAILNACLVGMASRKAGFAPDAIHPLALDHGQD